MEKQFFLDLLKRKSNELKIELSESKISQFYSYKDILLEWNNKINLTAITNEEEIIIKHFIDSLTIIKYLNNGDKIVDVGTGAGFPGIPLKIVKEDLDVILLDSLNKRIIFLNEVIKELKLLDIIAIHARAEEFGQTKQYREKFDIVTSRAVANLSTLLEYMLPLAKVGGSCICMKGANIDEELKNIGKALEVLGGKIEKIEEFELPGTNIKRNNIIIKKVKNTPNIYPRKAGKPSKEPIL